MSCLRFADAAGRGRGLHAEPFPLALGNGSNYDKIHAVRPNHSGDRNLSAAV